MAKPIDFEWAFCQYHSCVRPESSRISRTDSQEKIHATFVVVSVGKYHLIHENNNGVIYPTASSPLYMHISNHFFKIHEHCFSCMALKIYMYWHRIKGDSRILKCHFN